MSTLFSQEVSFAQALPVLLVLLFLLAVAALVVLILVRYFHTAKQLPQPSAGTTAGNGPLFSESQGQSGAESAASDTLPHPAPGAAGNPSQTGAPSPTPSSKNAQYYYFAILLSLFLLVLIGTFTTLSASHVLFSALASAACAFAVPDNARMRRAAMVLYVFCAVSLDLAGILLALPAVLLLLVRDR